MNDELTPSERSALRAQILGGARGIKPVGAHRNAVIAGSIAAVLVVAIAGGVAATSTLSAPPIATTPSPSATVSVAPAPTAAPTASPTVLPDTVRPVIAFGGDCARMLSLDEVSSLTGGGSSSFLPDQRLAMSFQGSLASIGGISCSWMTPTSAVSVVVAAEGAIDREFAASLGQIDCSGFACVKGRAVGDLWIGVQMPVLPSDVPGGLTEGEETDASVRIDAIISTVSNKPHTAPVPVGTGSDPSSWALPDCDALRRALEDVTGERLTGDLREGSAPLDGGLAQQVVASSAGVTTCAFGAADQESRSAITIRLTPGVADPPQSVLDVPFTFTTEVGGADRAWTQTAYDHVYDMDLMATVGQNSVVIHRMTSQPAVTDAELIAATVIDLVDGRG
ncbi:hypothetical protein [Microbacterium sp. lyk4-40-TSB-66]|uniref:hypothetical protein n=1 Tax=Microbacterium sp. lyk4-40-TSB-66 TaxID=3040294 RepID=UPI00254C28E2|nr:hypothetical protein [Microbacterium sp. lyk4-40-TSB-66]